MSSAEEMGEQAIGEALAAITASLDRARTGRTDLLTPALRPTHPVLAYAAATHLAAQFAGEAAEATGTTAEEVIRRKALQAAAEPTGGHQ